jgi:carbon monoxide dehydrogenase subunit G
MRSRLEREVDVSAPAGVVWDYVTDWPRQSEWVPKTRVETVDDAASLGGRFRAWTGLGRVGFVDPMTITRWERDDNGGGRCEVLHTGRVVRGEGEFTVVPLGADRSRFVWAETVVVPGGGVGALAWRVVRPGVARLIDRALDTMRRIVESEHSGDTAGQ